jgi:hypothetical protein
MVTGEPTSGKLGGHISGQLGPNWNLLLRSAMDFRGSTRMIHFSLRIREKTR